MPGFSWLLIVMAVSKVLEYPVPHQPKRARRILALRGVQPCSTASPMAVALAFFSVLAVAFPFALDPAAAVPDLLLIPAKQRRVAFIALRMTIRPVILVMVPVPIPPAAIAIAVLGLPRIGRERGTVPGKQQGCDDDDHLHR